MGLPLDAQHSTTIHVDRAASSVVGEVDGQRERIEDHALAEQLDLDVVLDDLEISLVVDPEPGEPDVLPTFRQGAGSAIEEQDVVFVVGIGQARAVGRQRQRDEVSLEVRRNRDRLLCSTRQHSQPAVLALPGVPTGTRTEQ